MTAKPASFPVRLSPDQRSFLELAAKHDGLTLTELIRRSAMAVAENILTGKVSELTEAMVRLSDPVDAERVKHTIREIELELSVQYCLGIEVLDTPYC